MTWSALVQIGGRAVDEDTNQRSMTLHQQQAKNCAKPRAGACEARSRRYNTISMALSRQFPRVRSASMPRIGLLVPSSNTTVEPEFYRALPRGVTLHTARLFLTRIAPESILKMVEDMETQAKLLASADVDVIVLGATAPSFLKGLGYDRELIQKIETATGKPATTTSTALVQAIHQIGARRVVLGSAYDEKVNGIARVFL